MIDYFAIYAQPESRAQFDDHYQRVHIPKVLRMPRLLELTWGFVDSEDAGTPYMIARLTFASVADAAASFASSEGQIAQADVTDFASGRMAVYAVPRHS